MKKSKELPNSLIKQKNLRTMLRKHGIQRLGRDVLVTLEKEIEKPLVKLFAALREEMAIQGKKTLTQEEIKRVLGRRKEEFFEI